MNSKNKRRRKDMSAYKEYGLMPEEINLYKRFYEDHKACNPKVAEQLREESVAPIYTDIVLHMSTIGMCPSAKCHVCGVTKGIACQERLDSV
jgi:hypothetical protein